MWFYKDDDTKPVITASGHIGSNHSAASPTLPQTAMLFFMGKGPEYLTERYGAVEMPEPLPRFLNHCPIYKIADNNDICFLDGGRGAPQAVDTMETLAALGVQNVITVGMIGAFSPAVRAGEIIAPCKAFVEEGASLHYYEKIEYAEPDQRLLNIALSTLNVRSHPIVTTDAVYRQTFKKEQIWREKGAVGVDMETSAAFSVGKYLRMNVASLVMVSDIHPARPDETRWDWKMTRQMRWQLFDASMLYAKSVLGFIR